MERPALSELIPSQVVTLRLGRLFTSSTFFFTLVHKVVLRSYRGGETRARPELALRFVGGPSQHEN